MDAFVRPHSVQPDAIMAVKGLERLKLITQAVEALVAPDDRRREFLRLSGAVTTAYKALLPDERAAPYLKPVAVFHALSGFVKAKLGPVDIAAISERIAQIPASHCFRHARGRVRWRQGSIDRIRSARLKQLLLGRGPSLHPCRTPCVEMMH